MSDPITYTSFVQQAGVGPDQEPLYKEFRFRDDVEELLGYWAVRSDKRVEWVAPINRSDFEGGSERFSSDANVNDPQHGLFDRIVRAPYDLTGKVLSRFDNPASGRASQGFEVQQQTKVAFRNWLRDKGLKGAGISNDSAIQVATDFNRVLEGLAPGEDPHTEFVASIHVKNGYDMEKTAQLVEALGINTNGAKVRKHPILGADDALDLIDQSANVNKRGLDDATDLSMVDTELGGSPLPQHRGTAAGEPGSVGGVQDDLFGGTGVTGPVGGAGTPVGPQAPGIGVGGATITPELLREFVDSEFRFGFNAMLNNFRDAGAASIFMDWLSGQLGRFASEFEGQIASQALGGQIPQGTFVGFLSKKGLLDPSLADAPGTTASAFSDFAGDGAGGFAPATPPAAGSAPAAVPANTAAPQTPAQIISGGPAPGFTQQSTRPGTPDFVRALVGDL